METTGVLSTVRELGIGFASYSPLVRGFLTGRLKNFDGLDASDFRRTDPRFQGQNLEANVGLVDRIAEIEAAKGVKPSQLAIAWTINLGTVPIPGTRRIKYLEENVAAGDITMTEDELTTLDAAAPIGAATGSRYSACIMSTLNH